MAARQRRDDLRSEEAGDAAAHVGETEGRRRVVRQDLEIGPARKKKSKIEYGRLFFGTPLWNTTGPESSGRLSFLEKSLSFWEIFIEFLEKFLEFLHKNFKFDTYLDKFDMNYANFC